ncbi:MAG TPA: hypothetical protein VG797_05105, partial [Phycisphaerales bacterium]|nr:hypothetical protein [Phycisphaerales bacterium]
VARTAGGDTVMVIGHPHADSVALMKETSPGVFEPSEEVQAFPMKVELSVPEPGRLLHTWWYGRPGGSAEPRDATDARRVD